MYSVNDSVFCLMHGAGTIDKIEKINIDGCENQYYVISIGTGSIKIKIPVANEESLIRPIIDKKTAENILAVIPELTIDDSKNWSKRYRENMERLKTGDVTESARVLKSLILRSKIKTLSAGERKMLHSAKEIVFTELSFALDIDKDSVEEQIYNAIG